MVCVISDIHGCFHTFKKLLSLIKSNYSDIPLYCVGDLVDRGNFSFDVISEIIASNIFVTLGNHDLMFYKYYRDPADIFAKSWIYNGAQATIESYKNNSAQLETHLDLISTFPLFYNTEDCFISHAGISTTYSDLIDDNGFNSFTEKRFWENLDSSHSILWNRDPLLNIGKIQVVGHTRQDEVTFDKSSNSLYIDTGVYAGRSLTAVVFDKNKILEVLSVDTELKDIR